MARICFIELQPFPTAVGGGMTHLSELSKELISKGHDVSIITSRSPKPFKLEQGLRKLKVYQVTSKHKKLEDFKGLKKPFYYLWRIFFETSFVLGANSVLKKNKFDLISTQSPITTSLPCSLFGRKFYLTAHGVHNEGFKKLYREKGDFITSKIGSPFYRLIENFNAKRAEKIICLGKSTYNYYSKVNKCAIIPNGIDTKRFSTKVFERSKIIISVGRFTEQKAVDHLINAMKSLPDYTLWVVGLGPLEPQIKKLCSENKNCVFMGYKGQDEIADLLKKARFTVLPSLFEGLPISMLEAMSSGVIPITTRVGDIPSVVKEGKNGFFLKNNSPEEIARVVRSAERKDLSNLSRRGYNQIRENLSWEKIAGDYLHSWQLN